MLPYGIPRCVAAALFALAALRSVSRRATFSHNKRPICHFELVGKSVFFFPQATPGVTLPAANPWLGRWLCGLRAARSASLFWWERRLSPLGDDNAPQGGVPRGAFPSGDSLVTFSSGKVTPGAGRSACRWVQGLPVPQKTPGHGAERPYKGGAQRRAPALLAGKLSSKKKLFFKNFSKVARLRATFPLQRGKGERSCFE